MNVDQALRDAAGHFVERRFAEAASLYQEVLAANPLHGEALANLGSVRCAQGDLDAAADLYAQARDVMPSLYMAGFGLAKVRMAQGRSDDALSMLQEMNRSDQVPAEATAEFCKLIGTIYAQREDWGVAATFFKKYEDAEPDNMDAYLSQGRVAVDSGDKDALVGVLERMVAKFPDYAEARMDLVRLLGERGDYAVIRKSFDRILTQSPDHLAVYNLLVIASLEHRQYAYAYLYFLRARRRHPEYSRRDYPGLARMEVFL